MFFPAFNSVTFLSNFQYLLFISSIIFITAAGYVINDIFDIEIDKINKPSKLIIGKETSIKAGINLYKSLNVFGLTFGILLSLLIEKPTFSFLFIGTSLLLFYYSKHLKKRPLFGNLAVSFLVAFSLYLIILFDLRLTFTASFNYFNSRVILWFAAFAFLLNLAREVIKDIEDINGDYTLSINTLPILIGVKRTRYVAAFIVIISFSLVINFIIENAVNFKLATLYITLFVALPLLYSALKLIKATSKSDFKKLSILLKLIMFFGSTILLILSLNH